MVSPTKNTVPLWGDLRSARRRGGFTLIELLAAAVLSTLLLLGVSSLLRSSFEETRFARLQRATFPQIDLLARQLRRDFQNARGIRTFNGGVELYGFIGSDGRTGIPTQQLAAVGYLVQNRTLYRTEGSTRQALWHGVSGFTVQADEVDAASSPTNPVVTGGLPAMPPRVYLSLVSFEGTLIHDEEIFHHQIR